MNQRVHLFAGRLAVAALCVTCSVILGASQNQADPASLKNPVPATAESIAEGKRQYVRRCAVCHGEDAKGGEENERGPAPPDLTGGKWERASVEAGAFTAIKKGIPPKFSMQPFGDRLSDTDIWNVVNYLRSLSAK